MTRQLIAVLAVLSAASLIAACGGAGPASPSRPPAQAWARSLAPGSAWGKVSVPGPDGRLSLTEALQAFALAVGPVPGVSRPGGAPAALFSADLATDTVLADFGQLAAGERSAVLADLDLKSRPAAAPGGQARSVFACSSSDSPDAGTFRQQVAGLESTIGARTGIDFTIPVTIAVNHTQTPGTAALAYSAPCSAASGGTVAGCAIHVQPAPVERLLGGNLTGDERRAVLAHELTHCFLYQVLGDAYDATPGWYLEGAPTWVMATLVPDSIVLGMWHRYLSTPQQPLSARTYTAVGFWAHLQETGSDVFHDLVPVGRGLVAGGDSTQAGWSAAAPSAAFLDTWGPGYAGGRYPGRAWVTRGAGLPPYRASFARVGLPNGGSLGVDANPYATAFEVLDVGSDVVRISAGASTHGLLSLGGGRAFTLEPGTTTLLCTEDGGCAHCPAAGTDPTSPLPEMDAGREYLGITGGGDTGSATVVGESFATFCAGSASS